jgi:hypothetical protein
MRKFNVKFQNRENALAAIIPIMKAYGEPTQPYLATDDSLDSELVVVIPNFVLEDVGPWTRDVEAFCRGFEMGLRRRPGLGSCSFSLRLSVRGSRGPPLA